MSEQPDPYVVGFYCDPCARRSGRHRLLATANQNPATFGRWDIWVARRIGRAPGARKFVGNDGGLPHRKYPGPVDIAPDRRLVYVLIGPFAPAAQLICRRKVPRGQRPHRPRVALAKLIELAEQAMAAGRYDAYV